MSLSHRPTDPTETAVRLSLPRPDRLLSVRALDAGRHLIYPTKEKFEWEIAERVYRSVIVDAAGRVLSTGFAKFGNHGEPSFADADRALDDAIDSGREVLGLSARIGGESPTGLSV